GKHRRTPTDERLLRSEHEHHQAPPRALPRRRRTTSPHLLVMGEQPASRPPGSRTRGARMIRLVSRGVAQNSFAEQRLGRITTVPLPAETRSDHAFLVRAGSQPPDLSGYAGVLVLPEAVTPQTETPAMAIAAELDYLADGDVVLMAPSGRVNVLYRKSSR